MIVRELLAKVGIDFDPKGADEADKRIRTVGQRLRSLVDGSRNKGQSAFGQAFGTVGKMFMGYQALNAMRESLDLASAAEDQLIVLRKTFGDNAAQVEGWAQLQSDSIGRSKHSLMQYAGSLGSILAPAMGNNRKLAAEMSTTLAQLSVDLGSFYHQADDDTMARLRSGMLGSVLAVDQLGINLHEEALKAHAAKMGIKGYSSASSEAVKMTVRFNKIMADTIDKQGWAAKTSEQYDNKLRKLKEDVKDLSIAFGGKLTTSLGAVLGVMSKGSTKLVELVQNSHMAEVALGSLAAVAGLFALRWTIMNIPLLLTIGSLALLYFAIEDVYTGLQGGDSIIKDWFVNIAGQEAWNDAIRTWQAGKKALDDIMAGKTVADTIFDYVNPNINATGDEAAMIAANYDLAQRDMNRPANNSVRRAAESLTYGTGYAAPELQIGSRQTAGANRAGPNAAAYSTGPLTINLNGPATPSTAQEIARAVRNAQQKAQRDLYKTTGRFDVTQGGGGSAGTLAP